MDALHDEKCTCFKCKRIRKRWLNSITKSKRTLRRKLKQHLKDKVLELVEGTSDPNSDLLSGYIV